MRSVVGVASNVSLTLISCMTDALPMNLKPGSVTAVSSVWRCLFLQLKKVYGSAKACGAHECGCQDGFVYPPRFEFSAADLLLITQMYLTGDTSVSFSRPVKSLCRGDIPTWLFLDSSHQALWPCGSSHVLLVSGL